MSLRSASTLLVARDAASLEVLVVERPAEMRFAPGAHVFPGGALDPDDVEVAQRLADRCSGWSDEEASENLGMSSGGLAYWVAAVRECFEEVGLLFARHREGDDPVSLADREVGARFHCHRQALCTGRLSFAELVVAEDLLLDLGRVAYLSRWVTPSGRPLRYDTRFFAADAPRHQVASNWSSESVNLTWAPPGRLLERSRAGEIRLLPPTARTLSWAAGFSSVSGLLDAAGRPADRPAAPFASPPFTSLPLTNAPLSRALPRPASHAPTVAQGTRPAPTLTES